MWLNSQELEDTIWSVCFSTNIQGEVPHKQNQQISFYPTATLVEHHLSMQGTQRVVGPCALGTPNKKLVPRKICTKRSIRPMQLFFSFDKES